MASVIKPGRGLRRCTQALHSRVHNLSAYFSGYARWQLIQSAAQVYSLTCPTWQLLHEDGIFYGSARNISAFITVSLTEMQALKLNTLKKKSDKILGRMIMMKTVDCFFIYVKLVDNNLRLESYILLKQLFVFNYIIQLTHKSNCFNFLFTLNQWKII